MSPKKKNDVNKDVIQEIYDSILGDLRKRYGTHALYTDQVTWIARRYLGNKYKGTFPYDLLPKLTKTQPYAIINTDHSGGMGLHWVAVARIDDKHSLVYDSFGRKTSKIIPQLSNINGSIIDSKYDKEQEKHETDCGIRSIAFLIFCDKYGLEDASKI